MSFSFWSDEDRLFVPRMLGWSINFKFIAKKLGWINAPSTETLGEDVVHADSDRPSVDREERLRRSIEQSRLEDK